MTDLRELLGSTLTDEPESAIDPYAAMATGRTRRRARRHRWLAGGTAAAVVLGVGAAVGLPRLAQPGATTAGVAKTPGATFLLDWRVTEPAVRDSVALDAPRTLTNLEGAAERIQQTLALPAVSDAQPYRLPGADRGVLQLAYRTADGVEVHVVLAGSATMSAAASCAKSDPVPPPPEWPNPGDGERPLGSAMCVRGPDVATTRPGGGRLDRTVAADVEPLYRGAISVTVSSDAAVPAPTTVAAANAVVDSLRPHVVFARDSASEPDSAQVPTYTGPVASTTRDRSLGMSLYPPDVAARLDWHEALRRCEHESGGFCSDSVGWTISYGLVTLDNPATINADGTTTRQVVRRPAYVLQRWSQRSCPGLGGPPIHMASPSASGYAADESKGQCRWTVILDAGTGSALYAVSD